MKKRLLIALMTAYCAVPALAWAQAWPAKSIALVVPGTPGTSSDLIARELSQKLAAPLGQSIVVDNRAGASGVLGTDYAARSKPDGYVLFIGSTSGVIAQVSNAPETRLERHFEPVALAGSTPFFLTVPASFPINSVAELVAEAKRRPGQLNYAGFQGGIISFLGEMLKSSTGIDIVQVPYKNTPAAQVDVIAGRIQIWFSSVGALALAKANQVRVLAMTGHNRAAIAPTVPTMKELGYPAVTLEATFYILAPNGTPKPIIDRLNREINTAIHSKDTMEHLAQSAIAPTNGSPEETRKFIRDELAQWEKLIAAPQGKKS